MADDVTYYTTDDTGGYVEAELPSFSDSIPEELRESEHIKGYGDVGAMATALHDFHSNTVELPETADDYTIPDMPEGVQVDTETIDSFKALALAEKIPQSTVDKLIQLDIARAQKAVEANTQDAEAAAEAIKKNREESQAELDKEWGATKAAKMELVGKVKTRFLSKDLVKKWDESGLSDDPDFIKLLAGFGSVIDEGHLILPDTRTSGDIPRGPDGRPILQYKT